MHIDRREFVKSGAALAALGAVGSRAALAAGGMPAARSMGQMAWAAGTWYRPYVSKPAHAAETTTWVQIDLGARRSMDAVRVYPAFGLGDMRVTPFGFPVRFRIETADDATFTNPRILVDAMGADFAEPYDEINEFTVPAVAGRYVRLTATALR